MHLMETSVSWSSIKRKRKASYQMAYLSPMEFSITKTFIDFIDFGRVGFNSSNYENTSVLFHYSTIILHFLLYLIALMLGSILCHSIINWKWKQGFT